MFTQDQGSSLYSIGYYGKKMTGTPHNYATHDQELPAIVAIKKWWANINGKSICIITDYALLTILHSQPNLSSHQIH